MLLKDLAVQTAGKVPLSGMKSDAELASDVQNQLISFGILDPPADGRFGPVSDWALHQFCVATQLTYNGDLTSQIARELLGRSREKVFPIAPQDDLAGRIVQAMTALGHWIARHPDCKNIVYVEGLNMDGEPNDNAPNKFNDVRMVLQIRKDGVPEISKIWKATTEPGTYWTQHPMEATGAARIAFGQYKAWTVGIHHYGKPNAHEALVQADKIRVYRDLNKDYSRTGDTLYEGVFVINQHWGYDLPDYDLGKSSAGCLVGQTKDGHKEFMALVKSDPRYQVNNGYRFMTTVLPAVALQNLLS